MRKPPEDNQSHKAIIINRIVSDMQAHHITFYDLEDAIRKSRPAEGVSLELIAEKVSGILERYGLFILSMLFCIATYILWDDINPITKTILTLGCGIGIHIKFIRGLRAGKPYHIIAQLLLISAVVQFVGWFELLKLCVPQEGGLQFVPIMVTMLLSAEMTYYFLKFHFMPLLATALFFVYAFLYTVLSCLAANQTLVFISIGISMMATARMLQPVYTQISIMGYLVGACMFYIGLFDLLDGTTCEFMYLLTAIAGICLSMRLQSQTLLSLSSIALIGYIGYATSHSFLQSAEWPLSLMFHAGAMFGIATLVLHLKRRFMK